MGFVVPAQLAAQGALFTQSSAELASIAHGLAAAGAGLPLACGETAAGVAAHRFTAAWSGELVACAASLGHLGSATAHGALAVSEAAGA